MREMKAKMEEFEIVRMYCKADRMAGALAALPHDMRFIKMRPDMLSILLGEIFYYVD